VTTARPPRPSKPSDETETPPELYHALAWRYVGRPEFDLDAAASHENALADAYYTQDGYYIRDDAPADPTTPAEPGVREVLVAKLSDADGLTGSWGWRQWVWVNPPYSDIEPWVVKAWAEMTKPAGTRPDGIVMLLPSRTDRPWWQTHIEPYRVGGRVGPVSGVELTVEHLGRVDFLRNGQPIPATSPKTGEVLRRKDGRPRKGSPRFGVSVVVWRAVADGSTMGEETSGAASSAVVPHSSEVTSGEQTKVE